MWKAKLTLEQIKTIISDCIAELDPRQTWMITWLDKIALRDDGTPYIKVAVHHVHQELFKAFSLEHLNINKPRWIALPLRLLRVFPVGTLLHNGMAMFGSHHGYIQSFALDMNTSSELIRTTLGAWRHGSAIVNAMRWNRLDRFDVQPAGRFAVNSKIVVYPHRRRQEAKFDFVVFPAAELARFYWFPSSRFFRALVEGEAAGGLKNKLYVPEITMAITGEEEVYHQIIVRDSMHLRDAEFIARLAFSPEAYYSANTIYQSVLHARLEPGNRGALHLDCVFPFRTDTTVKVHGYVIRTGEADVLIVTELLQCCGPWPFDSLKYDRETPRPETDDSLKCKGKKHVSDENQEKDQPDDEDNWNDQGEDDEDIINGFVLRNPKLPSDPRFDHIQRNNSRVKHAELDLKSQRFPTLTAKKERLKRYRKVPPKNTLKVPAVPIDNISVNDNKQTGGGSTNIDLVSTEGEMNLVAVDWGAYVEKLCEFFRENGCDASYIANLDNGGHDLPHQVDQVRLLLELGRSFRVSFFVIHVCMPKINFIVCEMDRRLRTSLKIIIKSRKPGQAKAEFTPDDLAGIYSAIKTNYQTLDQLHDPKIKSNLKVIRLYHLPDASVGDLGERILVKVNTAADADTDEQSD